MGDNTLLSRLFQTLLSYTITSEGDASCMLRCSGPQNIDGHLTILLLVTRF